MNRDLRCEDPVRPRLRSAASRVERGSVSIAAASKEDHVTNRHLIIRLMAPALALAITLGCSDLPTAAAPPIEVTPTAPAVEETPTASAVEVADVEQALAVTRAPGGAVTAAVALEDALARALPALEDGGETQGLEEWLRQLHAQLEKGRGDSRGLYRALEEVQNAIDRYLVGAGEEFQPDVSVVQLAVDVVAAGDTEEGSPKRRSGS
jgi:hypothetical protein